MVLLHLLENFLRKMYKYALFLKNDINKKEKEMEYFDINEYIKRHHIQDLKQLNGWWVVVEIPETIVNNFFPESLYRDEKNAIKHLEIAKKKNKCAVMGQITNDGKIASTKGNYDDNLKLIHITTPQDNKYNVFIPEKSINIFGEKNETINNKSF